MQSNKTQKEVSRFSVISEKWPKKMIKSNDEDLTNTNQLLCLQRDALLQQMENRELEKEKLKLEIWLLRKRQETSDVA